MNLSLISFATITAYRSQEEYDQIKAGKHSPTLTYIETLPCPLQSLQLHVPIMANTF